MDEPNLPLIHRACLKCGFAGETTSTLCPQCGKLTQTTTSIRIRGLLMLLCGGFLISIMGYITFWTVAAMNSTTPNGAKFNGTREQLLMILGLFGLLILFGLASLLNGVWQLAFGTRNRLFVWIIVGLAALAFAGGGAIIWRFPQ